VIDVASKSQTGDWRQRVQITNVEAPRPQARRVYVPAKPSIPGVLEEVWANYEANARTMSDGKGGFKVVDRRRDLRWAAFGPAPAEAEDELRRELLAAKNFLNYQHNLIPPEDIHGLEKKDVVVADPTTAGDIRVRQIVPEGEIMLLFAAHPGMPKGMGAVNQQS
jgi:hypothetical protein